MSSIRTRWAAIGAAIAVTLGAGGIAGVEAALGTGERAVYVPIPPCRLFDTRPEYQVGARGTPIGPGETITLGTYGSNGQCTLPTDLTGVVLNVTAVAATQSTFLTFWPTGAARPNASSLNPQPGAPPTPNAVTTKVSASGQFDVYNLQGSVHVLADVAGYFVDHHHDDRYYTEAEINASYAALAAAMANPDLHRFSYNGESTRPTTSTASTVWVRDLGTFTSHGVPVKVTWSSAIGGTGTACNYQIRIDGAASRTPSASGLVGTEATINGTIGAVPATIVDTWPPLSVGEHTVELWYRAVNASCTENVGNYTRLVIVEEYGLSL